MASRGCGTHFGIFWLPAPTFWLGNEFMLHVWWFLQDMLPRWGRQPGLGIEGTAADYLQWVMEGRLACVDRASRGAPGILHCSWCPGPSRRAGGSYCHPISVSKRHGLTQCPFSLTDQHLLIVSLLISQSINLFNHLALTALFRTGSGPGFLLQRQPWFPPGARGR